jgi:hypothetical protein
MREVITMFTDLANMNREFHFANEDYIVKSTGDKPAGFNDQTTAAWFIDLMSTIFGRQDIELANELIAEALIREGRKPNFWIRKEELRKKAESLNRIP